MDEKLKDIYNLNITFFDACEAVLTYLSIYKYTLETADTKLSPEKLQRIKELRENIAMVKNGVKNMSELLTGVQRLYLSDIEEYAEDIVNRIGSEKLQ